MNYAKAKKSSSSTNFLTASAMIFVSSSTKTIVSPAKVELFGRMFFCSISDVVRYPMSPQSSKTDEYEHVKCREGYHRFAIKSRLSAFFTPTNDRFMEFLSRIEILGCFYICVPSFMSFGRDAHTYLWLARKDIPCTGCLWG